MKRLSLSIAVALAFGLAAAPGAGAAKPAKPIQTSASILGNVVTQPDGTAHVRVRYVCGAENHLWVSAKQTADGRVDRALEGEGSSALAAAWAQSHPTDFVCDGTKRTQTFTIAPTKGELKKGKAWIQFCLTSETGFFMETRWAHVK